MPHNILLVSHSDFPANSAVHVHHYANELVKLGCDCVVAVPYNQDSVKEMPNCLYSVVDYNHMEQLPSKFENGFPPQIVHCWTPREHVRKFCCQLSVQYDIALIIHLEDNEECVTSRFLGISLDNFDTHAERLLPHNLSHPRKYKDFLNTADGVTIIIEKLKDFIEPNISYLNLFPGVDSLEFYPRLPDLDLLKKLEISEKSTIICYTGNVHLANQEEVRELYLAIGTRNRAGKKTVLIRTGIDNNLDFLGENDLWVKEYVREMGWVKRAEIPSILSIADILVQPGGPDEFNDYRFPSKIPEFLAMGKPVILPRTNIANHLTHLVNSFILSDVNCYSLVETIDFLMDNPEIRSKIIQGGLEYAKNHLDWGKNSEKLLEFYDSVISVSCSGDEKHKLNQRFKLLIDDYQQANTVKLNLLNENLNNKNQYIQNQEYQISELLSSKQLLESEINAMRSSKFWKLRELWFGIKEKLL
ncbi:glycosyltransferase [Synechocystis salina]|uniref:Glycosyltransferase n=2 Tax=Synechocystis TaxID=1142 RepID=A0ABR9VV57_9SYNC|nr:glycosyltransferase [Synechocystis salina]MBE9241974.1 glycosyltransferase [Synechocystis salina LEGE 00041]MBE9255245.1 glycosyltransferase [Synechocystis salina LEGE 00031]